MASMKRLLLLGLLALPLAAQEPVAKIVEIKPASAGAVKLEYWREGKGPWAAYVTMDSRTHDQLRTDANTMAALELDLGGRVAIRPDSHIEILSERSVKTLKVTQGGVWVKCGQMKESLEIQTTGGVMGIKGTEFVVEADGAEQTTFSLLEGEVEVSAPDGSPLGTMKAGDQWVLPLRAAVVKRVFEPGLLRRQILDRPDWQRLRQVVELVQSLGLPGVQRRLGGAMARIDERRLVTDLDAAQASLDRAGDRLQEADARLREANDILRSRFPGLGTAGNTTAGRPPRRDFVSKLTPNHRQGGTITGPLHFRWDPLDGATSYAVLISATPDFLRPEWTGQTTGSSLDYPADARPLEPGRHYWRVVPLGADDQPLPTARASQTFFDVK